MRALAKRLGKSHGTVSEWLSGKNVCSTQAEVLHELELGPPPPELPTPAPRVPTDRMAEATTAGEVLQCSRLSCAKAE